MKNKHKKNKCKIKKTANKSSETEQPEFEGYFSRLLCLQFLHQVLSLFRLKIKTVIFSFFFIDKSIFHATLTLR